MSNARRSSVFRTVVVVACIGFVCGCSSASTTTAGSSTDGDGDCSGVVLTVKAVPVSSPRCLISVAGRTPSGGGVQTVCVPTGVTTLSATPLSGFELEPNGTWHGTDGDTGSGDKGTISSSLTSKTTLTVKAPGTKCVWACCPGLNNAMPSCPKTDQCQ